MPHSSCIKNNTQQKSPKQKLHGKNIFLLLEEENLTDSIKLPGPPDLKSKFTINISFILQDPLDIIPLSKTEIQNNFLPVTENITPELF